ncbi:TPA: RloB domain-containing protein [Legionella pneumophila]|nr:RloB domain-containing protein [Legionella pneumophila]HBC0467286.1 RloB domain-containing protein [Legionella pneumophila]
MGTDNIFHKRKGLSLKELERTSKNRESYDVVLIVCEGGKTEPNYLTELRNDLKLSSANIKIAGRGTDPLSLITYALDEFDKTNDYNRIFCVFDKDQHSKYNAALKKIQALNQKPKNPIPINAIYSVPCFEYWMLLHYVNHSSPYIQAGKKKVSDQVIAELKHYIPNYSKGQTGIYGLTKHHLETAMQNAKHILKQQQKNCTDNPSTNIFELIDYLRNIKKH